MTPPVRVKIYLSKSFLTSDAYNVETAWWLRIFYLWLFAISFRMPYYFAWKVSEVSCILAGIGYSGDDANNEPQVEQKGERETDRQRIVLVNFKFSSRSVESLLQCQRASSGAVAEHQDCHRCVEFGDRPLVERRPQRRAPALSC